MKRVRVSVSPLFFLSAAALYFFDTDGSFLHVILASALHELGHVLASSLLGGRVTELRLDATGARMNVVLYGNNTLLRELFLSLSGPLLNFLSAFLAAKLGTRFSTPILYVFSGASLALGLFNLLPLSRLDGGQALRAIFFGFSGKKAFEAAFFTIELALSSALALFGLLIFLRSGYNFTLLSIGAWCFICTISDIGNDGFYLFHPKIPL